MEQFEAIIPIVVVDGTVVATIGATVAAATGVTVLKIGFCKQKTRVVFSSTVCKTQQCL